MRFLAAAVLLCVSANAEVPGFALWKNDELKGMQQKLAAKVNDKKLAGQPLANWGNHTASMSHREGDGEAEVHEHMNDIFVVQTGEATLVVGGQVVSAKTTEPNEVRGPSIKGGEKKMLRPGDIVHIPANTAHQLLVEKGKEFTYFVVKVAK